MMLPIPETPIVRRSFMEAPRRRFHNLSFEHDYGHSRPLLEGSWDLRL